MASPNVPLESKSKLLHESAPIEGIDYHAHIKQFYPQNEHEGDSDSHKGLPSPRMGNCIQSIDNEEVINFVYVCDLSLISTKINTDL